MKNVSIKFKTVLSLGIVNCVRVILYRCRSKLGLNTLPVLNFHQPVEPFFSNVKLVGSELTQTSEGETTLLYFGHIPVIIGSHPPDWHFNPINNCSSDYATCEWWRISDFSSSTSDIKIIWEASRFDWAVHFSMQAKAGNINALDKLNDWLSNWCEKNPPYYGINWKCGQEASFRVLHLAMSAIILDQINPGSQSLIQFLQAHLRRIELTLSYAISQNNNHSTSEAAALFVGGSWLVFLGIKEGEHWYKLGCYWLERHLLNLLELDGSFSQYSLNYHRVLIDTLNMVEIWRKKLELSSFSVKCQLRIVAAIKWLTIMVHPETGDAPNLGANDGARLLQITNTDYRDYRPTVQLAMALFCKTMAYKEAGLSDQIFSLLGIERPENNNIEFISTLFDQGGFAVLRKKQAMAILRYPRFRFRPSQADILHLDFWVNGENLLRDGGTYSYNTDEKWLNYFSGTASHNTIQFDERDQMPKLSRFLFGAWLKTHSLSTLIDDAESTRFSASYIDYQKAKHNRKVELTLDSLKVTDEVSGFQNRAVLRWRLQPGNWKIEGNSVKNGRHQLSVVTNVPIIRFELIEGWESRYYLQKEKLPVLEVEITQAGSLFSEYKYIL